MALKAAMFSSHDAKITRNSDRDMPVFVRPGWPHHIPGRQDGVPKDFLPFFLQISPSVSKVNSSAGCENFKLLAWRVQTGKFGLFYYTSFAFRRTTHSAIDKFHYIPYTLRFCIKDATEQLNALYYSLFMQNRDRFTTLPRNTVS